MVKYVMSSPSDETLSCMSDYAATVKAAFKEAVPSGVLEERFLGPKELCEIYSRAV